MAWGADPLNRPRRTARHRPPLPGLARPQSETAPNWHRLDRLGQPAMRLAPWP
jgi:hypothetical protein